MSARGDADATHTWYVKGGDSEVVGPVATALLVTAIKAGRVPFDARVCPVGGDAWSDLLSHPEFASAAMDQESSSSPIQATPDVTTNDPAQSLRDVRSDVPTNFEVSARSYGREFSEVTIVRPVATREEMELTVRRSLGAFLLAPRDFARSAHLSLWWAWFPIVVGRAAFESEWVGTATPYRYVESRDSRGELRREKRRLGVRSFSGSLPSEEYTTYASGDPEAVPQSLLEAATSVGSSARSLSVENLLATTFDRLPEQPTCVPVRISKALASTMLSALAHDREKQRAESALRSLTDGNWESRNVQVRLRAVEQTYRLLLMPALVGTYAYRGRRWRAIAFSSTPYAGCEGAPTSVLKVVAILVAAGATLIAALAYFDVLPVRSWVPSSPFTENKPNAVETTQAPVNTARPSSPSTAVRMVGDADASAGRPSVHAVSVGSGIPISALDQASTLPPGDEGFVDTRGGAGWGDRCWTHLQAGQLAWAKAECDRAMEMNPSSPQPRASLLYNEGLIEKKLGHKDEARTYFEQSLALRPHPDVQAALDSLDAY